jgi:AcrR family transcriptional regulator
MVDRPVGQQNGLAEVGPPMRRLAGQIGIKGAFMCAKIVDKEEKKDHILKAAIGEFAKKGFTRTTISNIAGAAGIGKGTVYEYFKNKEEIINYSFNYFMRFMQFDIEAILIKAMPAREKMEGILDLFSDMNNWGSADFIELMFDFWSEGIKSKDARGGLLKDMNKFYRSYREIFADIIVQGMGDGSFRKDINPGYIAAMVVGCLDGIMVQWVLDKEAIDFSEALKTIKTTILRGILLKSEKTGKESV